MSDDKKSVDAANLAEKESRPGVVPTRVSAVLKRVIADIEVMRSHTLITDDEAVRWTNLAKRAIKAHILQQYGI